MVFSLLHWVPSAIAAILAISLVFKETRKHHRNLARLMILAALVGLVGRLWEGDIHLFSLNLHAFHSWTGLAALLLSLGLFVQREFFRKRKFGAHCQGRSHDCGPCSFHPRHRIADPLRSCASDRFCSRHRDLVPTLGEPQT